MEYFNKVQASPNACFVGLFFSGSPEVMRSTDGKFYSSKLSPDHKADVYTTAGTIKISETGKDSRAGMVYTQTIEFIMPTTDNLRAVRIDQFKKTKFVSVTLTTGQTLFFGRNDVRQNTRPKVTISSTEKLTKIQFSQNSISPLAFLVEEIFTYQDGLKFIFQDGSSFNK